MARRSALGVLMTIALLTGCSQNKQANMVDLPPPVEVDPAFAAGYPQPVACDPGTLSADGYKTYSVTQGDTLWSLASRYYSNGQRWRDIAAANPGIDPKRMGIGQTIVIP